MDGDGDSAIVQQIGHVEYHRAVLLMETPVTEAFHRDTRRFLRLQSMTRFLTFNNKWQNSDTIESNILNGNLLSCTLLLVDFSDSAAITLEITAADPAGNATSKRIELTNSFLSDIREIAIYNGNAPAAGGEINLEQGESARLKLMGLFNRTVKAWIPIALELKSVFSAAAAQA